MLPLHAMILIYAERAKFIGHTYNCYGPEKTR
jgi:hypothetical protein